MLPKKPADRTTLPSCWCAWLRNSLALLLSCSVLAAADPAAGAVTILRVRPIEGEGQVFATNTRSSRALTIQVTDETGKPVTGATVSFSLPNEGPGGVFTGNMKTDIAVTAEDGKALMSTTTWNGTPGPFSIRVTAAKDGVRAGIVVAEYLSDNVQASPATHRGGTGRGKWMKVGLIVAGAAGAGLVLGWTRGEKAATSGEQPIAVQIGSPSISIGKP